MHKVLLPVDGSPNSLYAVRQAARDFFKNSNMEIHLLNVRRPLSANAARFVSKANLDGYYREEAEKALKPCREVFDKYAIPYFQHIRKGDKAEEIVSTAQRLRCAQILVGCSRKNSLTRALEASTTNRILQLTTVPVLVVSGDAMSPLERYGFPAGVGAAITALLMFAAVD